MIIHFIFSNKDFINLNTETPSILTYIYLWKKHSPQGILWLEHSTQGISPIQYSAKKDNARIKTVM